MLGTVADVRDYHGLKAAVDAGVDQFGRLDIVLANAGIASVAFRELTIEEELDQWAGVLDVNLVGAFHTARRPLSRTSSTGTEAGSIIFTSSTAGLKGFGGIQGGARHTRRPNTGSLA